MSEKPSLCFFHTGRALPHILLGEGPSQAGGAEVRASILARALAERGWPLTFIICDYGQPDELMTDDGIRLLKAGAPRGGLPVLRFFTHTLPADIRAVRQRLMSHSAQIGMPVRWPVNAANVADVSCSGSLLRPILMYAGRTFPWPAHMSAGLRSRA